MKRTITMLTGALFCALLPLSAFATTPEEDLATMAAMRVALIALFAIGALLLILSVLLTVNYIQNQKRAARRGRRNRTSPLFFIAGYVVTVFILVFAFICLGQYRQMRDVQQPTDDTGTSESETATQEQTDPPTDPPTEPPTEPQPTLNMSGSDSSDPKNWGVNWQAIQNGDITDSFNRNQAIMFGDPTRESYFTLLYPVSQLSGVITTAPALFTEQ